MRRAECTQSFAKTLTRLDQSAILAGNQQAGPSPHARFHQGQKGIGRIGLLKRMKGNNQIKGKACGSLGRCRRGLPGIGNGGQMGMKTRAGALPAQNLFRKAQREALARPKLAIAVDLAWLELP